ncbi:hypothetical protein [Pseudonocardia endophytica]|uniref:Uncharacterized protein n=1 Tax=Pseudonocardia endophytica TaxID=401976 RepID=A0A4R1HKP9_PSEEN|nr:hypothetical protein [Pseudonocardia endophytica]TCK22508.1 hypothetical protein EV378_6513 [Pseudonocardia endophytica]
MTDVLAPWANLGMLVVVGGVVTLVLVGVALTDPGARRSDVPRTVGALGAVAAFVAGLAVTVVAMLDPADWWLDLAGWGVWIVGDVVVFALVAVLLARTRRSVPPGPAA